MSEVKSDVISEVLEDMVRTELTDQADSPQPDPDRLLRSVARTRRRGNVTATAAVMVLVFVVGAGVWIGQPDSTKLTALPPGAELGGSPQVWFADPDHGFALADTCPNPCGVWLAYTTDGGRSWHGHPIPGLRSVPDDAVMRVLGPTTVLLDEDGGTRWHTADSGATWTHPPGTPDGPIDHIPPGATALIKGNAVHVLTPDGHTHILTTITVDRLSSYLITATDGSAWIRRIRTEDPVANRDAVTVSRDGGRSWQPVDLPQPCRFDTYDGIHLYCADGIMIWRKTGSAAWQQLTPPADGEPNVQPDGGILLTDTPTGDTFYAGPTDTAFTTRPNLGRSHSIGARRLRPAGPGFEHSADGHAWTPLRF